MLMLNAAMLGSLSPVAHIDGKEFSRLLTLNVLASQALIAAFDPLLRKSDGGPADRDDLQRRPRTRALIGAPMAPPRRRWRLWCSLMARRCATRARCGSPSSIPAPPPPQMRQRAYPGEDQATLKPPSAVAEAIVATAAATISRPGDRVGGRGERLDAIPVRDAAP